MEEVGMLLIHPPDTPAYQKIREHLEQNGIMRSWFAEKMGKTPGWATQVLNEDIILTEENRIKAEKVLNIKL